MSRAGFCASSAGSCSRSRRTTINDNECLAVSGTNRKM
jgi:hypothetical protein